MSEYIFGCGDGHLPKSVARIAKRHNTTLINHVDPGCKCGHGCDPFGCKASRRHWFATDNRGEPFNSQVKEAVLRDVLAASTKRQRGR